MTILSKAVFKRMHDAYIGAKLTCDIYEMTKLLDIDVLNPS